MTLNTSNFSLVFDDQFGSDPTYNAALWPDHWGNPDQSSFGNGTLTMTGYQSQGWSPVGMMQTAAGAQAGEGYGLYQFTGYGNPNQGAGVAVLMWRADNQFLPSSAPGVDSEIDLLESLDGSKTVLSTEHYYDASWQNDDGQIYHTIDVDPSVQHTYSVNWERGSLTYYIDGQEYWQDTSHVPLDAADGGCNEVLGAEVQGGSFNTSTSTVQLHIVSLSYSAPSGAAASMPTISLTQPGTVQEPGKGAGVTVTETVTTSNQTGTIYLEVLTQTGATESAFIPLTLSGGRVSAAVHMANPGDLIRVVDAEATADTAGVTITDAPVGVVTLGGASQSYAAPAGATVQAGSGADTVEAAAGDVTVLGGAGNITFINGSGASDVTAGTGAATLFGGAGGGRYAGGSGGHNVLVAQGAGGSNTTLAGAVGGDVLFGSNTGNNVMVAGAGSETLVGGTGATTMLGGAGSTVMFTGNGSSSVVGGSAGGDTIIGAAGALQVTAQHGDAVFGGDRCAVLDRQHRRCGLRHRRQRRAQRDRSRCQHAGGRILDEIRHRHRQRGQPHLRERGSDHGQRRRWQPAGPARRRHRHHRRGQRGGNLPGRRRPGRRHRRAARLQARPGQREPVWVQRQPGVGIGREWVDPDCPGRRHPDPAGRRDRSGAPACTSEAVQKLPYDGASQPSRGEREADCAERHRSGEQHARRGDHRDGGQDDREFQRRGGIVVAVRALHGEVALSLEVVRPRGDRLLAVAGIPLVVALLLCQLFQH